MNHEEVLASVMVIITIVGYFLVYFAFFYQPSHFVTHHCIVGPGVNAWGNCSTFYAIGLGFLPVTLLFCILPIYLYRKHKLKQEKEE